MVTGEAANHALHLAGAVASTRLVRMLHCHSRSPAPACWLTLPCQPTHYVPQRWHFLSAPNPAEFCSRGCLKTVLEATKQAPLSWPRRLSMALDAAKGMLYL